MIQFAVVAVLWSFTAAVLVEDARVAVCVSGLQRDFLSETLLHAWAGFFVHEKYDLFLSMDLPPFVTTDNPKLHDWPVKGTWFADLPFAAAADDTTWCREHQKMNMSTLNHVRMFPMAARWPACVDLIERHVETNGVNYDFFMYTRPDVLWTHHVPDVRELYAQHRGNRDVMIFDDHAAIGPIRLMRRFLLGGFMAYMHCPSLEEWRRACENEHARAPHIKQRDGKNIVKVPCCPVRVIGVLENFSVHDCGALHATGSRCLVLGDDAPEPQTSIFNRHPHKTQNILEGLPENRYNVGIVLGGEVHEHLVPFYRSAVTRLQELLRARKDVGHVRTIAVRWSYSRQDLHELLHVDDILTLEFLPMEKLPFIKGKTPGGVANMYRAMHMGICRARELGCEWVWRSRFDMLIERFTLPHSALDPLCLYGFRNPRVMPPSLPSDNTMLGRAELMERVFSPLEFNWNSSSESLLRERIANLSSAWFCEVDALNVSIVKERAPGRIRSRQWWRIPGEPTQSTPYGRADPSWIFGGANIEAAKPITPAHNPGS